MFNPQQQAASRLPPTSQPMQPPPPQCQNEISAKEKLASYVYEYLIHSGATKAAESFKTEVLANTQTAKNYNPCETGPGFLQNWFLIFWDLYCAAPERRDAPDAPASQEAKFFCDQFMNQPFAPPNGPMMNGMHGPQFGAGPSPMGMPGPDGMIPGHPGAAGFAGRFPPGRGPGGMPPGFAMFPGDPRMAQRLPPNAMRMQGNFPGMRPGPPGQPGMPPYGRPQGFLESPGGSFPPGAMMPNGGVMCSQAPMSMSSPGPGGPPMVVPSQDPNNPEGRFMMIPASSSAMPFGMSDQQMPSQHSTQGGPHSAGMSNGTPGGCAPNTGENGAGGSGSGMVLMNGEDIKHSPASTPRGVNGTGTPVGAGPGSQAPGSVQSQGAGAGSGDTQSEGQPTAPTQEHPHTEEQNEITKIKQSLFDDVTFGKGEDGQFY